MPDETPSRRQIDRFILEEIDSVPHLEALLLVWRRRPANWSYGDLARALYLSEDRTFEVVRSLLERGLIVEVGGQRSRFALLLESKDKEMLLESLDLTYRRELVRVSHMIHSKASPGVLDFARAFRFKKD